VKWFKFGNQFICLNWTFSNSNNYSIGINEWKCVVKCITQLNEEIIHYQQYGICKVRNTDITYSMNQTFLWDAQWKSCDQ
jgi:hypothetical protein